VAASPLKITGSSPPLLRLLLLLVLLLCLLCLLCLLPLLWRGLR
jgi:hypothetical protein